MHISSRLRLNASPGFSLVEVALAVAIAALGIITCLGLLPEGIEMSRKTGQMAINSNVLDQIIRDIENAQDWKSIKPKYVAPPGFPTGGNVAGASDKIKLYDYQGTAVQTGSKNISFVASIDYDLDCYLPGSTDLQNYLARLRIRIANSSDSGYNFPVPANGRYVTFYHLVAKSN